MSPIIDIEPLLAKTNAFIQKMYFVHDDFNLLPKKPHIGTCLNFSDTIEMRDEFVEELLHSITRFVYSSEKIEKIHSDLMDEGRDCESAYSKLLLQAKKKFRTSDIRGQFSELLLCNLLQHHFKAIPILRKMAITTNPRLERNGVDAIHLARKGNQYIIYIGEAKTYNRKKDSFKDAFKDSVEDVIKHYLEHRKELNLYIYDDFIPPELENFVRSYIAGTEDQVEVHLVCMVSYNIDANITGKNRVELLDKVINNLRVDSGTISKKFFDKLPQHLLPRLNYILFPIQEMEDLLTIFSDHLSK
jgi:predicted CopG family antitoxin